MEMTRLEGFLLTSHWQDTRQSHQLIFYGVSDAGPFKVIIDNNPLVFFIKRSCQATFDKEPKRTPVNLTNFDNEDIDGLYFQKYKTLTETRDLLLLDGIATYESDIRPTDRFLMEHFVNGGILLEGVSYQHENILVFKNPKISRSDYSPHFKVFSIDIETSGKGDLYSIAYHCYSHNFDKRKIYMRGEGPQAKDLDIRYIKNEKQLLVEFQKEFHRLDPDIIIGWHVIGFDLALLEKKYRNHDMAFNLGREHTALTVSERKGRSSFARMKGRVVLDGPTVMRAAFFNFENFKLETVARTILGTGKNIHSEGVEKVKEISKRFNTDKVALARYNLKDCLLVSDIFKKTELIQLLVTRTNISGMLFDQMGFSIAAFDHFYLPLLHRRGFVAPNVADVSMVGHSAGGYVLEPQTGLHEHVAVFDFRSLYPSIIQTFKIDPLARICRDSNTLETPEGYQFSRTEHILTSHIGKLLSLRAKAKKDNDAHLSQAIKILMNSFYGVMGSSACRFYHNDLPSAITTTGHWALQTAIAFLTSMDYTVIYGDTDSVFVKLSEDEARDFTITGKNIAQQVSDHLKELIEEKYRLESHLEMEYEKYFSKFFLPPSRSGAGGAKKRYAGLCYNPKSKSDELYFVGMEIVRSDWTKLAKKFQYELFKRLFDDQEIIPWIKGFVCKFNEGQFNDLLVYKKRLTKGIDRYVKSTPPHVKAAKQLLDAGMEVPRNIEYVMTLKGPVPIMFEHHDIDYAHYIEKQIKPLADSVLWMFNINFNEIFSGIQLTLFNGSRSYSM
jgi:DNA polymerase II